MPSPLPIRSHRLFRAIGAGQDVAQDAAEVADFHHEDEHGAPVEEVQVVEEILAVVEHIQVHVEVGEAAHEQRRQAGQPFAVAGLHDAGNEQAGNEGDAEHVQYPDRGEGGDAVEYFQLGAQQYIAHRNHGHPGQNAKRVFHPLIHFCVPLIDQRSILPRAE